jgi:hypothetical protein
MNLNRIQTRLAALQLGIGEAARQRAEERSAAECQRQMILERIARYEPEEQDQIWLRILQKYFDHEGENVRMGGALRTLTDTQLSRLKAFLQAAKNGLAGEQG